MIGWRLPSKPPPWLAPPAGSWRMYLCLWAGLYLNLFWVLVDYFRDDIDVSTGASMVGTILSIYSLRTYRWLKKKEAQNDKLEVP